MSDSEQNLRFADLPRIQVVAAIMLVGFAIYMVWDQIYWWGVREDYSFGYLVPLFAAYVIYDRSPVILSYLSRGHKPGDLPVIPDEKEAGFTKLFEWVALAGFVGAAGLYAVGGLLRAVTGPQNPASLAIAAGFGGVVLSTVFIFTKESADGKPLTLKRRLALTALFLFPALIWLISAPLVSVLETKIKVFLLTKVTIIVFWIVELLGYDIQREGNVLVLPEGKVGVEEACSGILSLMACLFAGSFLAAVFLNRFWKKVLLVLVAMCLAVFTNLCRSIFLTLWAYYNGSQSIDEPLILPLVGSVGTVHDVAGYCILGFTCLGLILLLPIFNYRLQDFDEDFEDEDTQQKAESLQ
ncbi:MAG: exosortase/archaeosortase family protein [Lentimonas sp.]